MARAAHTTIDGSTVVLEGAVDLSAPFTSTIHFDDPPRTAPS